MAEFVQHRLEETISELEQMERIKLFTKEEIRLIANKRKRHEYKMQRRTKVKNDYLRYIQYEVDLLKLIRQRRKEMKIYFKKKDIDFAIQNRIKSLFLQATSRFKSDVKLWISLIQFTQTNGLLKSTTRILIQMLAVHSDKPKLWKFAANWEFTNKNIDGARKLLLRGLRFHPRSKLIYKAYFIMELEYANLQLIQVDENDVSTVTPKEARLIKKKGLDVAGVIYSSAMNELEDVQFATQLFHLAGDYSFTEPLQMKILAEVKQKFCNDEIVCDLEAKFLMGKSLSVEDCKDAYSKALEEVPTERMWTLYLEALLSKSLQKQSQKTKVTEELIRCHKAGLLNAQFYPGLVDSLLKNNEDKESALEILLEGIGRHPNNSELRKMCIEMHLKDDKDDCAMRQFQAAEEHMGQDNIEMLDLYMHVIQFLETRNFALANKFFMKGVRAGPNLSAKLKPCYVRWLYDHKDINQARKEYAFLNSIPPLCLKLHTKMIELEMAQTERDIKIIRRCYELACQQFGNANPLIWLNYIKFETELGDAKRVSAICSRAKAQLNAENIESFMTGFVRNRSKQ